MVTLSTTESEYVAATAAAAAAKEAVWIRILLNDMRRCSKDSPIVYVDNQIVIKVANNLEIRKRMKHMHILYHFLREKCQSGIIKLVYVNTDGRKADILTKPLPRDKFFKLLAYLGMDYVDKNNHVHYKAKKNNFCV